MSGRYIPEYQQTGDVNASPALRDAGRKLVAYLVNQTKFSGVRTLSTVGTLQDGSQVVARIIDGIPSVTYYGTGSGKKRIPLGKLSMVITTTTSALLYQILTVDIEQYYSDGTVVPIYKTTSVLEVGLPTGYAQSSFLPAAPSGQSPPFNATKKSLHSKYIVFASKFGPSIKVYNLKLQLQRTITPTGTDFYNLFGFFANNIQFVIMEADPTRPRVAVIAHARQYSFGLYGNESLMIFNTETGALEGSFRLFYEHSGAMRPPAFPSPDPTYNTNTGYDMKMSQADGTIYVWLSFANDAYYGTQRIVLYAINPNTLVGTIVYDWGQTYAQYAGWDISLDGKTLILISNDPAGASHFQEYDLASQTITGDLSFAVYQERLGVYQLGKKYVTGNETQIRILNPKTLLDVVPPYPLFAGYSQVVEPTEKRIFQVRADYLAIETLSAKDGSLLHTFLPYAKWPTPPASYTIISSGKSIRLYM